MREDYLSIISRPHHVSAKRCPMSMSDRAAQFAPFAALTGYDEEIDETARLTAAKRTLTEDEVAELNKTLCSLLDREYENVKVKILYFKPDGRKSGGAYTEYLGTFKYYRADMGRLVFTDGFEVGTMDIAGIEVV